MTVVINPDLIAKGGGSSLVKSIGAAIVMPSVVTEDAIGNSYLNTPVIDNLEFPQGAYTDLDGNTINYGAVVVNTVVFEVNMVRNIKKTKIQGRNGTVKEYISDGDFQITCRGMVSNKDNVFPLSQARGLLKAFQVPQQLPVTSLFLNDTFEIFDIVIESWTMPQVEGKRNEIPFSFIAYSDVPLDLEELE